MSGAIRKEAADQVKAGGTRVDSIYGTTTFRDEDLARFTAPVAGGYGTGGFGAVIGLPSASGSGSAGSVRSAAAAATASSSSSSSAASAKEDDRAPASVLDQYQYVQRRGLPPRKDRTWGHDVMFYPGGAYLGGLLGGCMAGLVLDHSKRQAIGPVPFKLRANAWINSMGKYGSRSANGLGCTAIFYASYKHLVMSFRGGREDQYNSIGAGALAASTFYFPKGWKHMAVAGVAGAAVAASFEFVHEQWVQNRPWIRAVRPYGLDGLAGFFGFTAKA